MIITDEVKAKKDTNNQISNFQKTSRSYSNTIDKAKLFISVLLKKPLQIDFIFSSMYY